MGIKCLNHCIIKYNRYNMTYYNNYIINILLINGKLLNCLIDKDVSCVPVWFMRQA